MYVAPPNSMEGAITVMTMKKSVAQLHPEVHEAILKLAEVIGKHLLISHGVKAEDIVRYDRIYKDGTQPK
jgi:hypothetical protein